MRGLASFLDELQKIAATRAVREWRNAAGSGQQGTADQIAQGYGQLGLKPRYLENVSGGGMEAGVDKMMGRAMGPEQNTSGYLAQKLYKPDSPLTTGKDTTALLQEKQRYTDTARSLSPEAKSMVPAMYGHREIQGPQGQLRHVSEHEYIPDASSLRQNPQALEHAQRVQDVVAKPMAAQGMHMGDIARVHEGQLAGNTGNVVMSQQGPKVVDFLPNSAQSPVGVVTKGTKDFAVPASSGGGRLDTGYGSHNMPQLRRDVFRPQASYQPPVPKALPGATATVAAKPAASLAQAATHAVSPTTPVLQAATRLERKAAPAMGSLVTRALKPAAGMLHL